MNIIITGASRGIGKAIANKFASSKQENTILLCARNAETLGHTADEMRNKFTNATIHFYSCDLSKKENIIAFAEWVFTKIKNVDILVNNAGSFIPGSVYNEPEGALENMLQTNLLSAYHLTRALLPKMIEIKKGHIFNICSIAALNAYHNGGAYSISKFALAGFSKNLREEMKPFNIKVTSVFPGAVFTDSWKGSGVPQSRIMESEDIAEMIYSASQLSPQACVEDIVLRPQAGDLE